jgi:hypothetical protein
MIRPRRSVLERAEAILRSTISLVFTLALMSLFWYLLLASLVKQPIIY